MDTIREIAHENDKLSMQLKKIFSTIYHATGLILICVLVMQRKVNFYHAINQQLGDGQIW